jgi:hypothetical protein
MVRPKFLLQQCSTSVVRPGLETKKAGAFFGSGFVLAGSPG